MMDLLRTRMDTLKMDLTSGPQVGGKSQVNGQFWANQPTDPREV